MERLSLNKIFDNSLLISYAHSRYTSASPPAHLPQQASHTSVIPPHTSTSSPHDTNCNIDWPFH